MCTAPSGTLVVAQLAKALDEDTPGWAQRIDLRKLDMCSGRDCILGQIYGRWWDWLTGGSGFSRKHRYFEQLYPQLHDVAVFASNYYHGAWVQEIWKRRS